MPVTSAYEVVANSLKTIIDTEFAAEGVVAIHDNLHESLGRDRRECGIAPVEDSPPMNNGLVLETLAEVRFFDFWTQEISPTTPRPRTKSSVSPSRTPSSSWEAARRSLKPTTRP